MDCYVLHCDVLVEHCAASLAGEAVLILLLLVIALLVKATLLIPTLLVNLICVVIGIILWMSNRVLANMGGVLILEIRLYFRLVFHLWPLRLVQQVGDLIWVLHHQTLLHVSCQLTGVVVHTSESVEVLHDDLVLHGSVLALLLQLLNSLEDILILGSIFLLHSGQV